MDYRKLGRFGSGVNFLIFGLVARVVIKVCMYILASFPGFPTFFDCWKS